jgi:hypothetical protein
MPDEQEGRGERTVGGITFTTALDSSTGRFDASAEWSNHWQMLDVGLSLRGLGYRRVTVKYSGSASLAPAGEEARVQREMASRFQVHLDWGST